MKKTCKQFEDTLNTLYKTKSKFYNGYLEEVKKQGYNVYRDSVGNHKIEFNVESNENSVVRKKKINSKLLAGGAALVALIAIVLAIITGDNEFDSSHYESQDSEDVFYDSPENFEEEYLPEQEGEMYYTPSQEILDAKLEDGLIQVYGKIIKQNYRDSITLGSFYTDVLGGELSISDSMETLASPGYRYTIYAMKGGLCCFEFDISNNTDSIIPYSECTVSTIQVLPWEHNYSSWANENVDYDTSYTFYAGGIHADGSNYSIDTIDDYLSGYDYEVETYDYGEIGFVTRINLHNGEGDRLEYEFFFDKYGNGACANLRW